VFTGHGAADGAALFPLLTMTESTTRLVTEILRAGQWPAHSAVDRLCLSHDQRYRRRLRYVAIGGTALLLDLPHATVLNAGDGLKLDDGTIVLVEAAAEALVEVTAPDAATLLRLAWHIGNRHLAAQLDQSRIIIRDDHVISAMLLGLGAEVRPFQGAFSPESGAYHEHTGPVAGLAVPRNTTHLHE
jgi:urease accessory protein